jgi:mRNA interferase MazF
MRRGEVRWTTTKAPDKRRPVLNLTRDSAIGFLNALTVAPITTTVRDIPSKVPLTPEDGLLTHCAANMDNLQTVPKHRLGSLIAFLSPGRVLEVNRALAFALGLDVPDLWSGSLWLQVTDDGR